MKKFNIKEWTDSYLNEGAYTPEEEKIKEALRKEMDKTCKKWEKDLDKIMKKAYKATPGDKGIAMNVFTVMRYWTMTTMSDKYNM